MDEARFNKLVNDLKSDKSKFFWKIEDVESYLSTFGELNKDETFRLLEYLVEGYIFRWLEFICYKLPTLFSPEPKFIELLKKIILKVKGDMAQGPFFKALISIGSANPDAALTLIKQMISTNDQDLIFYSSFFLGGIGRKDYGMVIKLVTENFGTANPHTKAAYVRALRVIFETEDTLRESDSVFRLLSQASEDKDIIVKNEAANAWIDFNRFDPKRSTESLLKLADQYSQIRYNIANRLWATRLAIKEDEIKVIKICSSDDDALVLSKVSLVLANRGKDFLEDSLNIIKDWIAREEYFKIDNIEYCLSELGKGNLERCLEVIEGWLEKENEKLQFFTPLVLREVARHDYKKLIDVLNKWLEGDFRIQKVALETSRNVLTEIYTSSKQFELINPIFLMLEKIALQKNVDIKTVIRGEKDKIFQCFRLINELELVRKELDFVKIYKNLEQYPELRNFIGEKWFKQQEKKKNKIHPFLVWLYNTENKKVSAWLHYVNDMLKVLAPIMNQGLKNLSNGLKNEDQFWQTISELEVISMFVGKYPIEIEPIIKGKKLDAKVGINGGFLVEVINPEMFKPLKYLRTVVGVPNRARDKIYDEFKQHLKDAYIDVDIPIVIVIDIGRSEIDYDFVEDYLFGTLQLTMIFDTQSGEAIQSYPKRAEDSMSDLKKEMNVISAIICYKTRFEKDGKAQYEGKIILNSNAKNALTEKQIQEINQSFFVQETS